jgi:hypothetical protein
VFVKLGCAIESARAVSDDDLAVRAILPRDAAPDELNTHGVIFFTSRAVAQCFLAVDFDVVFAVSWHCDLLSVKTEFRYAPTHWRFSDIPKTPKRSHKIHPV